MTDPRLKAFVRQANHGKRLKKGAHRRFFWRVVHRIGPGWDKMSDREVRKAMRQFSWRRPK